MSFIDNIKYDYQAIKKYGLRKHIKYLFDLKHTIVILQTHLDYVPPYIPRQGYRILEVDYSDPKVLDLWANIVNDAFEFEHPYDANTAYKYLTQHPYKKIENMYFLYYSGEEKPIGAYFIGRLKNNDQIGTAGRIAIVKAHQRKGLGSLMALFGYQCFRDKGIELTEEVFYLEKDYSIKLFLKCGSLPQFDKRYMQTQPTRKNFLVTYYAKRKVSRLYLEFLQSIRKPYLEKNNSEPTISATGD